MVNYTTLSYRLVATLRHNALKGLTLDDKAMVKLSDLLSLNYLKSSKRLMYIMFTCPKQRLRLEKRTDGWYIGANQGHSFKIDSNKVLEALTLEKINELSFENFIHGTYKHCIESIKRNGLNKMNRQHIHIATGFAEFGEVKSGFRKSCEVLIYLDVKLAITDGYKFYLSQNGVILTEGNERGYLPAKYIMKIINK